MTHAAVHAHGAQILGALQPLVRWDAGVDQRQLDIVQRGGAGQQIKGLEDETDFFVANTRKFVVIKFADELSVEPVAALARGIEAADEVHQRRFARARRSHDGDVFVALDPDVDATQRLYLLLRTHVVGLPQIFGADHTLLGRRHQGFVTQGRQFRCHSFLLVALRVLPVTHRAFAFGRVAPD